MRDWYLDLLEVRQKISFKAIAKCISIVFDHLYEKKYSNQISPADIQNFLRNRLLINKLWGRPVKPVTINRNVVNFKDMLSRTLDYVKLEINPVI